MEVVRIFLSHSSKDKPFVRKIAASLKLLGIAPWLDEVEIKPGDSLFGSIGGGLVSSDYVFAIISHSSLASRWVDEELRSMMNTQIRSGVVKIIPILIDDAEMPWFLAEKKYVDFRQWDEEDNYRRAFDGMVASFGWIPMARCRKTGLEFVKVEEGPFKYGPNANWRHLPTFWISRFTLTAANLLPYLDEFESKNGHLAFTHSPELREQVRSGRGNFPALYVPVGVGFAFANWAGFSVPTEEQWEKAARGADGRAYPWGETWEEGHCNCNREYDTRAVIEAVVAVDAYAEGRSPYGCFNMAGNVVEITSSIAADNERDTHYVGRGGSFAVPPSAVTTYHRDTGCSDFGEYGTYGYRYMVVNPEPNRFDL